MGENKKNMNVAEEIDNFLIEHEFEGGESEHFVDMLVRASKELKALMVDGDALLKVIESKNYNSSLMRNRIADLEKENRKLKDELKKMK